MRFTCVLCDKLSMTNKKPVKYENTYLNFLEGVGIKFNALGDFLELSPEALHWYRENRFDRVKEENARTFLKKLSTQIQEFLDSTPRQATKDGSRWDSMRGVS